MDMIGEAWAKLDERCGQRMKLDKDAARALALAVLEEVEGAALQSASAEVNDHFVEDVIVPLRARIAALGGSGGAT
jgi:hypothetical protein